MVAFLEQILNGILGFGVFAPLLFILIYVVGTTFFVPTAILTLAAGALFGVPMGFALALISSLAGASGVFLAGRYLSRGWVLKKIISNEKFKALDNAVAERGWKIVLLLRLSAILPFSVLNYGLGLSKISFKHHLLASWVGMTPGVLLYVYLGSLAGKIVFQDQTSKSSLEWASIAFGFVTTISMAIYSASIVKKALQTPENNSSENAIPWLQSNP